MKRLCSFFARGALVLAALAAIAAYAQPARADGFFFSTRGFSFGISTRPAPPPGPIVYEVAPPRVVPAPPPPPAPVVVVAPRVVPAPPPPLPRVAPPFDPYDHRPAFSPPPPGPRYGGLTPMPGPRPGGPMGPGGPIGPGPRPGGPMGPGGPRPMGPPPRR